MIPPSSISVILPCWEEAAHLRAVVAEVIAALDAAGVGTRELLLVVGEGARDGTPALAVALARESDRPTAAPPDEAAAAPIRVVRQPTSDSGYGRAVALGVAAARHEWLWLLDSDGQLDPAELPRLLQRRAGHAAVVGYRAHRADGPPRRLAAALYGATARRLLALPRLRDLDCAFKLLHADAVGPAPLRSRTGAVNAELLARVAASGGAICETAITHHARRGGRSRFELGGGMPRPSEALAVAADVFALALRRACGRHATGRNRS